MKQFLSILICICTQLHAIVLHAQQPKKATSIDSITLAQAYINLSLTNTYFEELDIQRLSKILPFEETELGSIKDPTFIRQNSTLYNFAYSLLHFNEAQLAFRERKEISQGILMQWKKAMDYTVKHFSIADSVMYSYYGDNTFYDLINFNAASRDTLHHDIFRLNRQFGPYFNDAVYPDFKRIFRTAQSTGNFHIDSLVYYTKQYDLEFNTAILNKEYDALNYDYGPHILPSGYQYRHYKRDYNYRSNISLSEMQYKLDPKLDLISRYVQFKYLISESTRQSFDQVGLYRLYNSYIIFKDDLTDFLSSDAFLREEDLFFTEELNLPTCEELYSRLQNTFSEDPYILAQAFINLSILNTQFEDQPNATVSEILSVHKDKLNSIQDAVFIRENHRLYHFTHALLYYISARLMFRTKGEISRDVLIQWKDTLEKGIISFNSAQEGTDTTNDWEQDPYHQLIKYDRYDETTVQDQVNELKQEFTPYFNKDIYPDFKRIFLEAKNSGRYDFEALMQVSKLYNFPLSLAIVNNEDEEPAIVPDQFIGLQYELGTKPDLISQYLQLKYLATDTQTPVPVGFNVRRLYATYRDFNYAAERLLRQDRDEFFTKELNAEVRSTLYNQLQEKYPLPEFALRPPPKESGRILAKDNDRSPAGMQMAPHHVDSKYFFPNPAPFPSASLIVPDFKPGLTRLSQVDDYLSGRLDNAGYSGQLHYYYDMDGFAIATSLEKFNPDGSPVPDNSRFVRNLGGDGRFSFYEIFKSIFFDVESEFRLFAFVVASKAASISEDAMTASFAGELLENSYPSLPDELKVKQLPDKKLTVLVYHFHQDDIGEVPMLDVSEKITAEDHLKRAGLIPIIRD